MSQTLASFVVDEDPTAWDSVAGAAHWARPGEILLWRGRPDPSVIFAPQDIVLVPFSLVWTGFFVAFEKSQIHSASAFSEVFGIPFLLVGSYVVLVRFFVKWWVRHRQRYAITNLRAVEVKRHRRSLREAPMGSPVEIRLRKGGRHATAIWAVAASATRTSRFAGAFVPPSMGDFVRGTGWPGAGWGRRWSSPSTTWQMLTVSGCPHSERGSRSSDRRSRRIHGPLAQQTSTPKAVSNRSKR
jgi:hypothetical protein